MLLNEYIKKIDERFASGISTEHSYRGDLQDLLIQMLSDVSVTNEPKRQKCGAPDYILQRKEVPIGYIEAKDIGIDLDKTEKSNQMKRYLKSLDNLILTDYLEFRFYRYGQKVKEIKIAEVEKSQIKVYSENFESFITHIKDFCDFKGQTIKSAETLAKMMAQKARMMDEILFNTVNDDDDEINTLRDQLKAFRKILIHDLDEKSFSDIYAQTIAYGLFAARLHDTTLEEFSRQKAKELIPKSNPFLRQLFKYVSDPDLDVRIDWIINDLADIFRATDLKKLLSDFGKSTGQNDPFIHFYETFLAEYDPKLRKTRGVYYTPEPVVNFIVRAVDDILKEEFDLKQGLADATKVKIKQKVSTSKKKSGFNEVEREVHKVQILDPATGTGTFLAEAVKHIYKKFKGQQGIWSNYVEKNLIPRVNGFEILMASYTMCHLKIEMLLKETGYKPKEGKTPKRLQVYLTNSLEEAHPDTGTLFASWLSHEATQANYIKQDTPVMVVMGNPPYSVSSSNKSKWIEELMLDYKKNLNEKNIQPLSDDYIKFIRFGQYFIDKNGEGILAFISNNSFIDGIIHRQMRKSLLKNFDSIYIIDLHGNSKKKETSPDGSKDENVFDIMQGVSINIFVKTGQKKKKELGKVHHYDLYGKRNDKYKYLLNNNLKQMNFNELPNVANDFYFVKKDYEVKKEYDKGFNINNILKLKSSGIQTEFDDLSIFYEKKTASKILDDLKKLNVDEFIKKNNYPVSKKNKISKAIEDISNNKSFLSSINYKLFNFKTMIYTGTTNGLMGRPRTNIVKHMIRKNNISLILMRSLVDTLIYNAVFISKVPIDKNFYGFQTYFFPLYVYPDSEQSDITSDGSSRKPNLDMEIVDKIAKKLRMTFTAEKEGTQGTFAPIDLLDYIYAVLHSPSYREKYKEFLKIDFPRVPYPDKKTFWQLVKLGGELRTIHLLESPVVEDYITSYPIDGDNVITRKITKSSPGFEMTDPENGLGRVWINDSQYFENVPETAWEFYIGGYQPAQKWLKDRKGRELNFEDLLHYQKIIVALTETDRIMKEIDKVFEIN